MLGKCYFMAPIRTCKTGTGRPMQITVVYEATGKCIFVILQNLEGMHALCMIVGSSNKGKVLPQEE